MRKQDLPPKMGCEVQGLSQCGRQKDAPKDIHVLIPEPVNISGYVAKGVNVANQVTLRWGDDCGSCGWAQCIHKEEGDRREMFEDAGPLALKVEEGDTGPGMQAASRSWKRPGNRFSLSVSREEGSPADTWILAQRAPFQTADLQKRKVINTAVSF